MTKQSNMTYDDFIDKVNDILPYGFNTREYKRGYGEPSREIDHIAISWTIGGITGGNCWGGEANQAVDGEIEPEFESFDAILEGLCPQITFMQYKRLCQEVVNATTRTDYSDYYGNSYEEAIKTVYLRELFEALKVKNLLPEAIPQHPPH
jgi:hypothetical protein